MKLRIGGLMLVFFSLVLRVAAQDSSNTIDPPYKKIVWNNTTVTLNGPNGQTQGDAPTVIQVIGGTGSSGEIGYAGGGIQLTAGAGGNGQRKGGPGGSILFTAGDGGSRGYAVNGGSITLQPGRGGRMGSAGNVILALPSKGAVGVGTTRPGATLDVVAGGTTLADAWTTRSSRRFKTNIQPLEGALEKVEQLQGVSYQRKSDGKHEIGVVAEEVDQIVPEVVSRDPKNQEVQGVDYSRLAALLIEAVKSQQAELRSQHAEIQHLKAQIEQLTSNPGGQ
jgi:hypothetical protein